MFWVEIPVVDVQACKASSPSPSLTFPLSNSPAPELLFLDLPFLGLHRTDPTENTVGFRMPDWFIHCSSFPESACCGNATSKGLSGAITQAPVGYNRSSSMLRDSGEKSVVTRSSVRMVAFISCLKIQKAIVSLFVRRTGEEVVSKWRSGICITQIITGKCGGGDMRK